MCISKEIYRYKDEILLDLSELISIPSVCGEADGDMPFGAYSSKALDYVLSRAADMGFKTKNVANAAGHAEWGVGEKLAGVLCHVDVVPAGSGWDTNPFLMTEVDGKIFGRGVADDKGAAIVALYCLKVLKDNNIFGNKRLRVIFGSAEETGMHDMELYFAKEELPDMAFSPDSEYVVCNREKGILHMEIINPTPTQGIRFVSGTAMNSVPDYAECEIQCDEEKYKQLYYLALNRNPEIKVEQTEQGAKIAAKGKSSHAMTPSKGINAAALIIDLLRNASTPESFDPLLKFASDFIGFETDGKSMQIQCDDEPSGPLTLNMGIVRMNDGYAGIGIDIRYPVTCSGMDVVKKIRQLTEDSGLNVESTEDQPPLYLPKDHPFIQLLCSAYEDVTGEPARIFSTGGGTYARTLRGRGVAFGPCFNSHSSYNIHKANESIGIDELMKHGEICLEAMYRMLTAE